MKVFNADFMHALSDCRVCAASRCPEGRSGEGRQSLGAKLSTQLNVTSIAMCHATLGHSGRLVITEDKPILVTIVRQKQGPTCADMVNYNGACLQGSFFLCESPTKLLRSGDGASDLIQTKWVRPVERPECTMLDLQESIFRN